MQRLCTDVDFPQNGEINAALFDQLFDNHVVDLGDLDEGQAELSYTN